MKLKLKQSPTLINLKQVRFKVESLRQDGQKVAGSSIIELPATCLLYVNLILLPSSKSTIIHYQCVSTGCCVHVARIRIIIDIQHVTKPMQRYDILPEQPKEKA